MAYLVIFGRQFVQAFLNDVVAIAVLDENDDVQAQRDNNRVNLRVVSKISLLPPARKQYRENGKDYQYLPGAAAIRSQSSSARPVCHAC